MQDKIMNLGSAVVDGLVNQTHHTSTLSWKLRTRDNMQLSLKTRLSRIILLIPTINNIMLSSTALVPNGNHKHITLPPKYSEQVRSIELIIGTDEGGRGMKALIVPGDLEGAALRLTLLPPKSSVVILSGFPCCVNHSPPTETDGPPGAISIARTALALGYDVILVTDECNREVFEAAAESLSSQLSKAESKTFEILTFPAKDQMSQKDEDTMKQLVMDRCDLIVACERAGPAKDGICYTMRGINMDEKGLIAPLHRIVDMARELRKGSVAFIGIGDGGNELGMGKVIDSIHENIRDGEKVGAVTAADYLIAASVSNWGGYALSAACAVVKHALLREMQSDESDNDWVAKCLPSNDDEIALLDNCVKVGCRDGVSGENEATVDGMPLETSLDFLTRIRSAASIQPCMNLHNRAL